MKKGQLRTFTFAAAVACCPVATRAIPQMLISDGFSTIAITDGGAGDANSAAGAITWTGSIGVWSTNSITGITKPVLGFSETPILNLSFSDTSIAAGTLTIMFSDTGYTSPAGGWTSQTFTGITSGSVGYDVFGASSGAARNQPFDTTRLLSSIAPRTGTFAVTAGSSYIQTSIPFSLTQVVTLSHAGAGFTTGNAFLRIPDGGSSIILLCAGLAGLGLISRGCARRDQ